MKYYLFNSLANNGVRPEFLKDLEGKDGICLKDVIGLDYLEFFKSLKEDEEVVLVGGDGTINYLVNAIGDYKIQNKLYLRAAGTGNDFLNDIKKDHEGEEEILLNPYIEHLPTVYVNGMEKKFINGIGYGIDGYCCEVADQIKEKEPNKKIDYTGIAIKGLLFHFKPVTATVTVDGVEETFTKVWLSPSMKGRFYGGGMMVAPAQDRMGDVLSNVVYRASNKFQALIVFPKIFKGEHVKKVKMVKIRTGKEITVKFDRPCALQIDGETVLGVSEYTVKA
ncbi:MAG: diacylglycerol kinase family protein [Bacilli bacterium]|nr:diacylglycerol kinase family protein [Bacilli bacterium]